MRRSRIGHACPHRLIALIIHNETAKRLLQRIRVPLGFLTAAVLVVFSAPTPASIAAGSIFVVGGVLIRAWAAGHIRKNQKLATSGPYAFTRNPLYLGSFLIACGFAVAGGVWWLALAVIFLFLGIYLPVMRVEEGDLKRGFGDEFVDYAQSVPLFVPRLTRWRGSRRTAFDFGLYLKHAEYNAAVGSAFGFAVLAAKMLYFGW